MRSNSDLILILGTGYMASVYFSHFKFLKENCLLVYRNKNSKNYKNAKKRFGEKYLISLEESINLNPKILLSCVSPESHLLSIKPFISKTSVIAVEKPPSLDMELMSQYEVQNQIAHYHLNPYLLASTIYYFCKKYLCQLPGYFP